MEKYLPLGSVVLLDGGEKEIMIYGRRQTHAETQIEYDYVACLHPEGNISNEFTYLFNHDKIDKILFVGCSNNAEKEFVKLLLKESSNNNQIKADF